MERDKRGQERETTAVHAGSPRDDPLGSVALPIHLTSAFDHPERATGGEAPYIYSRYTNPTLEAVEEKIARLENTHGARVFASGMAAIATALRVLLRPGDGVIASPALYGGTRDLLDREFAELDIRVRYLGLDELTPENIRKKADKADKVLMLESPTNPMLRVLDLAPLAEAAHEAGLRVVVDNTFAGPMLARPAEAGVDLVCESASKTMGGHSDLIAGAVATDHEDLLEALTFKRKVWGPMLDPDPAYRLYRGLLTLPLRIRRSGESARKLAHALVDEPWVETVHHPSLEAHPDYETAKRTLDGEVPLVSFTLQGGEEAAVRLRRGVRIVRPAVSLGGVESLLSLPSETSHAQLTDAQRAEVGIPPGTVRLSLGLEDPQDLLEDLRQAGRPT